MDRIYLEQKAKIDRAKLKLQHLQALAWAEYLERCRASKAEVSTNPEDRAERRALKEQREQAAEARRIEREERRLAAEAEKLKATARREVHKLYGDFPCECIDGVNTTNTLKIYARMQSGAMKVAPVKGAPQDF